MGKSDGFGIIRKSETTSNETRTESGRGSTSLMHCIREMEFGTEFDSRFKSPIKVLGQKACQREDVTGKLCGEL